VVDIRLISEGEFPELRRTAHRVFGWVEDPDDADRSRRWNELDRMFAGFDGDRMVSTAGALSIPVGVPGGTVVPAAAVTLVTTAPTYRRRGLMRRSMQALLDQALERDEPLATLWASESSIYGTVGFGPAIDAADAEIDSRRAALRADAPVGDGSVDLFDDDVDREAIQAVYTQATLGVPGAMVRRPQDWDLLFSDRAAARDSKPKARWAVYEDSTGPRGYARYRNIDAWDDHNPAGRVEVTELQVLDAMALAELWRFLTSLDLTASLSLSLMPVRNGLQALLADPRRLRLRLTETIWVRIVDPIAALGSRRYWVEGDIVVAVEDQMGYAAGTFALSGGPDGATVKPSGEPPDVVLGVETLGAAFLGAPRIAEAHWAGRARGDGEAIALADHMFRWPVEAACVVQF
jgi:predicted acetyltransferase